MFGDLYLDGIVSGHRYSLAATGIKFRSDEFDTRDGAVDTMHRFMDKHNLQIAEIWDDKHYKTYICTDRTIRFYVNRIV